MRSWGAILTGICLALGVAHGASAAPAMGTIRTGAGEHPAGGYLVVLQEGADANALIGRYGGLLVRRYSSALNGFALQANDTVARRMAADPRVKWVERDGYAHPAASPPWGLDRIDQHNLPLDNVFNYPTTATGVHVYLIDTGILFSHNEFGGRAVNGVSYGDTNPDATDCNGHGTFTAGIAGGSTYGVAKGVTLVAVKVTDCAGNDSWSQVIAGVDWVTHNAIKPAVVNISLTGAANSTMDTAVANSVVSGLLYVTSAGNSNDNACSYSPARIGGGVIAVGATDSTDTRWWSSNYGPCVNLFAPGVNITSAWTGTNTLTRTDTGTSAAAPFVTGVVAWILQQHPSYTPNQVEDTLMHDYVTAGVVHDPGAGSPNLLLFGRQTKTILVDLSCVPEGSLTFSCNASTPDGVAPDTIHWSWRPAFYGNQWSITSSTCRVGPMSVTVTVTDSTGASSSRTSSFYCSDQT